MDGEFEGERKRGKEVNKKAIALISGGLDSLLAARVVMEQGIEVLGVAFLMQFASRNVRAFREQVKEAAAGAGIPVRFVDISEEFMEVVKAPRHGYGSNLNPCIDCKILMLQFAKRIMREENAGFVITGEVLGERPMSQRKDALNMIRKRSELEGYLLRPLSARLLEETVPEREGIVDREKLLAIEGRSREPQLKMAKQYDLSKFFTPAGGCLLTDPIFARRLKDLMSKNGLTADDVTLLKYGRHFRLDDETKAVIGRNENDNKGIQVLKKSDDVMVRLKGSPGPYGLLRGKASFENIEKTASLVVSHSRRKGAGKTTVEFWTDGNNRKPMEVGSMRAGEIERLRVQ